MLLSKGGMLSGVRSLFPGVHLSNKLLLFRFAQGLLPCLIVGQPHPAPTAPAFSPECLVLLSSAGGVGTLVVGGPAFTHSEIGDAPVSLCASSADWDALSLDGT